MTTSPRKGHQYFGVTLALCLSILTPVGAVYGASPAVQEPLDPRLEQFSSEPEAAKISTSLLRLEKDAKSNLKTRSAALVRQSTDGGTIVEIITSRLDAAVEKQLASSGVKIIRSYPNYGRVYVSVKNLSALHDLARVPEVVMIRAAAKPRTRGVSSSIGVDGRASRAERVDVARTNSGKLGTGQKIGILSDSFAATTGVRSVLTSPPAGTSGTLTNAINQISNDLPATVELLEDFAGDEYGLPADEGAAMGELVHDVAPNAALAFHTAFISEADFAQGITDLRNAGCTVIVDDVSYFDEPVYQDGIVAQAAAACVANGVPYFSAAGNDANLALRQHFNDIDSRRKDSPKRRTGRDFHDWGGKNAYLPIVMPPDSQVLAVLNWNQPCQSLNVRAGSQVDMDMYLGSSPDISGLNNALAVSNELQGKPGRGKGDPQEAVYYSNDSNTTVTGYIVIDLVSGQAQSIPQSRKTPLEFSLMFFDLGNASIQVPSIPSGDSAFGGPTIFGHPQAEGVVAVGAIPWWESPSFHQAFYPTANIDPEYYTSRGGALTVFFDPAGRFAPRTALQPSITGVDGCDTSFFITSDAVFAPGGRFGYVNGYEGEPDGFKNFFGTSAAAPNAAAVAALMLEAVPQVTPEGITAYMQQTAIDVTGQRAATGIDDVTGPGLIDADAAIKALIED